MAIPLGLSGRSSMDLERMRQATLQLIARARANHRDAVHAMAGSVFHRLAPLTSDRGQLVGRAF